MWEQFLHGDDNAYAWLYDFYVRELFRYGMRFSDKGELIKDCIQEVFTSLYRNRQRLPLPDSVKAYLFVSLKYALWRALRKESVYKSLELQMMPFTLESTVEDKFIEGEDRSLLKKRVDDMLASLTPRQQEIIYYRFVQGMSFEEIGKLMCLNTQSAQNLIQRALKNLRDTYGTIPAVFYTILALLK
jgi:RNA polymerase sigma factor (sigma-70 family)